MSLQLVSSVEAASLPEGQNAVDSPPRPAQNDTTRRLAAIWTLRLALDTEQGSPLLGLRQRADNLLAVIGPWVDWPEEAKQRFNAHLQRNAEDGDPTSVEDMIEKVPVAHWQIHDWREFAHPFCCYATARPGPLRHLLRWTLDRLERHPVDEDHPLTRNVGLLGDLLQLSEPARQLLLLAAVSHEYQRFRQVLAGCSYEGAQQASRVFGTVLQVPSGPVLSALRKDAPLRRNGLLETASRPSDLDDLVRLSSRIEDVISYPHPCLDSLMQGFIRESGARQLDAEDYPHLAAQIADLVRLLGATLHRHRQGINLLLYGDPGTGKTEFAKLLASLIGARLFEVRSGDEDGDAANVQERMLGYRLAQSFLGERQDAVVLFDEVENVLGGDGLAVLSRALGAETFASNKGKAWLNQTLETNPVPAIWIANDIGGFDPAYLRRFFYSIEFKVPPRSVRRRIVGRHLESLNLGPACLDRLADLEAVSPAQFGQVSQLLQLVRPETREENEALLSRALDASMAAMGQRKTQHGRDAVTGYSLDFLNVESRFPIARILTAAQQSQRLSLCLFGPPGTGKTQLAHHLAAQLDRPLIAKRASDLLDKWLGSSEQNIRAMFQEANDEHAVLLLDEADSLLRDRAGATKSWEVTQVNELLQQMEAFDGIFLCATNSFENLDSAALRRFTFKLRFDYLTPDLCWRLFLQETQSEESQALTHLRRRLDRLDTLTPGDFATVKRQAQVLGGMLSPEHFLDQLEEEIRLKGVHDFSRPIGFVR